MNMKIVCPMCDERILKRTWDTHRKKCIYAHWYGMEDEIEILHEWLSNWYGIEPELDVS